MFADVGVKFNMTGAETAERKMHGLKSSFQGLSSAVDTHGPRIGLHFKNVAHSVKTAAITATAAIAGLTAAAVAIPTKLAMARDELTRSQSDLRALGKTDADIAKLEEAAGQFSRKVAGVTTKQWTDAVYDVVSAFADSSTEMQGKINDIAQYMGKATKMQAKEATELLGSVWGAAGDEVKAKGPVEFSERWAAAVYTAVKELKTTGVQLQAAAKNSISILSEAGWTPAQMTAFWGSLITAGLSGEQAGTAMKQMAIKERGAFGKLMAQASSAWIDTKDLKGKAKEMATAWNEGLIEGAGKVGANLFKADPLKWLDKISGAVETMKAQGQDYKKAIAEVFGEESVNAILSFLSKRKGLKDVIDKIGTGTFGDVRRIVEEEMSKGVGPASQILGQLWQGLKERLGSVFEPAVTGAMQRLGHALIDLLDWMKPRMDQLTASAQTFAAGFAAAFGEAGGVGSKLNGIIDSIVQALDKPDPGKWRQIGEEWGAWASVNFSGLVDALVAIKDAVVAIGSAAGVVNTALADLGVKDKKTEAAQAAAAQQSAAEIGKGPQDGQSQKSAISALGWPLLGLKIGSKAGPWGALAGTIAGAMYGNPEARPSEKSPVVGPFIGAIKDSMNIMEKSRGVVRNFQNIASGISEWYSPSRQEPQQEAPITIHSQPQISVRIGDREVRDIAVEAAKEEIARHRWGAGDAAFAMP